MAAAALLFDATFAFFAVALRVVLHRRRTGTNPIRGGRGISGPLALPAMAAVFALGPVLDLTGILDPLDLGPVRGAGLALMVAAIATTVWSQAAMGRSWRIGLDPTERTELVVAGPFRFVRNPIYTSMVMFGLGQAIAVANVVTVLSAVVLVVAFEVTVRRVEEPYLAQVHGEAYDRYVAAVGRFVPRIRTG